MRLSELLCGHSLPSLSRPQVPLSGPQLACEWLQGTEPGQVEEVAVGAHILREEHRWQSLDMELAARGSLQLEQAVPQSLVLILALVLA